MMKKCKRCGKEWQDKFRFCPECRIALPENEAKCPVCGEILYGTFCAVCGKDVAEPQSAATVGSPAFTMSTPPVTDPFASASDPFASVSDLFAADPGLPPSEEELQLEMFTYEALASGGYLIKGYKGDAYVTEITVPNGVKVIGAGAFKGYKYLGNVILPKSVKIIESEAFADCPKLVIEIPADVDCAEDAIRNTKTDNARKAARRTVGNVVKFGTCEQGSGKEAIEWQVLAVEGGKALLISKYGLDCQKYNTDRADVTWETCTLRKWLNETFYNAAFSTAEKARILQTTVTANDNWLYKTEGGNNTRDKVFLLSISEAEEYFADDEARKCVPTAYAEAQGVLTDDDYTTASGEATCWWWLRSPGIFQYYAESVSNVGSVSCIGDYVDYAGGAVRPALWIHLES